MQLKHTEIIQSPDAKDRVRLTGEVVYDDTSNSELYWFDVPGKYAESLSLSGNPWVACLLPLAVTLGEPLRICQPVDRVLFDNVQELMRIWHSWYSHLSLIPIEADTIDLKPHQMSPKSISLFSGGVDSLFTVLWHDANHSANLSPIDELICVWGFDIPLQCREDFQRLHKRLQKTASELNKTLIDVATNLLQTRFAQTDFSQHSHGSALASISLALEKRYNKVFIASDWGYKRLTPWGSHLITDPLLSTSQLKIFYDGSAFSRVEKTEFIAQSEIARQSLRVCWRSKSDQNCSACNKCYRTMITLDLLGVLNKCPTFDKKGFGVKKIARVYSHNEGSQLYLREVQALALKKGRADVAKAIERSFKFSRRLAPWYLPVRRMIYKMSQKRIIWRLAKVLDRILKAHVIA